MFKDTIFDNTKVVKQKYSYQYINILWPLSEQTEITIQLYDKIVKVMSDTSSMWDIGLE
tara:strand:+ start:3079 stop:3255 length:177 start_codon:yes stop_codon:yes gene_type:complete